VDYLATLPQPTPPLNLESFAQEWRQGYYEATREFATSPNPNGFQTVDEIHLAILRTLIKKHNLEDLWTEPFLNDINLAWHRLHGWPDATEGLGLLKENYIIGTLSNGNARLLIDMAKFAGLPWDVIFSGDIMKAYKPNPRMYLGACEYLQLPPSRVAMVSRVLISLIVRLQHICKI
jgi:2-haloalkanoic acid dehalogenase type II